MRRYQEYNDSLRRMAQLIHVAEPELVEQVEKMIAHEKELQRENDQLKVQLAQAAAGRLESEARMVKGARVIAARVDGMDRNQMRALADSLRNRLQSAVVVLASAHDSSIAIVSAVTKDLVAKVHAGKLAGTVAQAVGGKGGGRPDMAEAGGKDTAALAAALNLVYTEVESKL